MKLTFPKDIGSQNAYFILNISEFKSFNITSLKSANDKQYKSNTLSSIALPAPDGLSTGSDISWEGIDSLTSDLVNKAKDFIGGDKTKYGETLVGTTTDKPTQMAFNSVNLRTFSWSWELIPSNAQEASAIEEIIYTLEYAKLPEVTAKVAAKYPFIVKPKLKSKNKLIKYLPCVITGLNVDYSSGGEYREYKDGYLPVYKIEMSVSEIATLNKQIYKTMLGI